MRTLHLQNFQSHENTIIELAECMTAITGSSHHGKSSIVRAVQWVKDNKPSGDEFVRWDTKKTNVSIDNVTITKVGTKNSYTIKGKSETYKALRGAVPEEITKELNLGEVNVQDQHDSLFLLRESPGKVAQKLSELSDLKPTVTALQFISSKKRQTKAHIDGLEKSIETVKGQLHNLRHVDAMDSELSAIERQQVQVERLNKRHSQVYNAHKNAVTALTGLNSLPNTDALQPAKNILAEYNEIQTINDRVNRLNDIVGRAKQLEHDASFDTSKLLRRARRIEKMYVKIGELHTLSTQGTTFKKRIAELNLREGKLTDLKTELIGEECPLCGANNG